jgi:hypothetical protein
MRPIGAAGAHCLAAPAAKLPTLTVPLQRLLAGATRFTDETNMNDPRHFKAVRGQLL